MSSFGTLTKNERRALAAILSNRTTIKAAESCGLSERTLRRYMARPWFRSAITEAETAMIDDTTRRLLAGQQRALDALEILIRGGKKESDQRLAGQAWLDFTLRYRELQNIEQRVSNLEAAIYGNKD